MTKSHYDAIQLRRTNVITKIAESKAYRQVAMRSLCKRVKVPADTWRGMSTKDTTILTSLASTLVAFGSLTPKQYGLARRILSTHK